MAKRAHKSTAGKAGGEAGALSGRGGRDEAATLRGEVGVVVGALGRAMREVIDALPGKIEHAADLRRALDVDRKLSTLSYRVAHAEDGAAAAVYVPGPPSMKRLMESAGARGVSVRKLTELGRRYAEFQELVRRVAGDRTSFDSMMAEVGGVEEDDSAALGLTHRRAAFRAMSHTLGVQLDTLYHCALAGRAAGTTPDDRYDFAHLRLFRNVRRSSVDAPVTLFRAKTTLLSGNPLPEDTRRDPIDAGSSAGLGLGFMDRYCSDPMPEVKLQDSGHGWTTAILVGRELGRRGELDVAMGYVDRRVARMVTKDAGGVDRLGYDAVGSLGAVAGVFCPTRRFVNDLVIPASLFGKKKWGLNQFANVYELEVTPPHQWQRLHVSADVAVHPDDGRGGDVLRAGGPIDDPEGGNFGDLVRDAVAGMGWEPEPLLLFRAVIEYPVLYSALALYVALDLD